MTKIDNNISKEIIEELKERGWSDMIEHFATTKEMLPYVFLWSTSDYFSPHGNDTGFDVLALFRDWNMRYPLRPSKEYLKELFKGWEIDIENPYDKDYTSYRSMTYYQSIVSLAIAVVKVRGEFETNVSLMAVEAIDKYLKEIKVKTNWASLKECEEKALLVKMLLEQ